MTTQKTYRDHLIELAEDMRFRVTGPLLKDAQLFTDTFAEAKRAVDVRYASHRKAKQVKLSLACVNQFGERGIVTSIHAGHGRVIGMDADTLYPDVPWLVEAVKEMRDLNTRAIALSKRLNVYGMKASRSWGRVNPERYETLVEEFVEEHGHKLAQAQKDKP